ncbi:MAG: hypothetical protein IJX47_07485, partial [Clostridia bacterium]|nr:hypothetical protein [Clostridia bacterium]
KGLTQKNFYKMPDMGCSPKANSRTSAKLNVHYLSGREELNLHMLISLSLTSSFCNRLAKEDERESEGEKRTSASEMVSSLPQIAIRLCRIATLDFKQLP